VEISNVCGSVTSSDATLTVYPLPSKPVVTSSVPLASGAVTLCGNGDTVILSGPAGFSSYAWSDGASTQQATISGAGVYSVQVTDGNGCISVPSDAVTVIVDTEICNAAPLISPPTIIVQAGEVITIDLASYLSDADNNLDLSTLKIIASPTSGATAVLGADLTLSLSYAGLSFLGTDNMMLEVCDLQGSCTQAQLSIEVLSEGIVVYNGLSPNGDGLNDFFHIHDIDLLEETRNNHVTIFNRWGDQVFDVGNYNNTTHVFKGVTNGGHELPSGTYFYKVTFDNGRPSKMGYLVLKK
jgi:gliding motility-associated-like protein